MTASVKNPSSQSAGPAGKVSLWTLFWSFLRLGLTAFGGPAMVAYVRQLAVSRKGWLPAEVFDSGVALCQTIPGATAMQSTAYVGMKIRGPAGALACFVGFGLPAFVLMLLLASLYRQGIQLWPVHAAFKGLSVIVVAIVASATVSFSRTSMKNWRDALLAAGAAVFLILGGNPIISIAASAILSLLLYVGLPMPAPALQSCDGAPSRRPIVIASIVLAILAGALAIMWFFARPLFDLATLMLKVDIFAFGGGFASVPVMMHEVVDVRGWLDRQTFIHGIALGQVTPGPISITSTFVGYLCGSWAGAVVATICMYTPSFLLVLVTAPYFDRLQHSTLFRRAIRGVLASFVGLLLAVAITFGSAVDWSITSALLSTLAFVALLRKIDIMWVVISGVAISLLLTAIGAW